MNYLGAVFLAVLGLAFAQPVTAQSVTIEHKYGSTTVPETVERVVTVGLVEQDALLALGVVPVGTTEWYGEQPGALWPWARAELEALGGELPTVVGGPSGVDFETVLNLKPDLILALYSGITQEEYAQLSAIAPTVAQPTGYVDYGVPWGELTRAVGQAVGRADAAEAVVAEVEAQFAGVRAAHPGFIGATAAVAAPFEGVYVYGPEDARGRLLADLGFALPEGLGAVTEGSFGGNLSTERLDLLDVDVLVWLNVAEGEGPLTNPLYQSLRVSQEGREVFLDSFTDPLGAATSFVTPLSLPFLLDGLVPRLASAIDGDPATEVPAAGE